MVNTPIPTSLKSEAKKAAQILKEFSIPSASSGPDKIIPAGLIENASGLAILTVVKLGFLVTARGGSGIVIAKLHGGEWSAPSAIGIAGLGGGFEIGAEVTDFVIVLYKQSAVDAFSKGGNLTLGGNFTIAAGPLGRNLEGDVAVRSPAAIYTYSKTKGLFAGISIEGTVLIERKDANRKFYGEDIRAYSILSGEVDPPDECRELYEVLANHREMAQRAALAFAKKMAKNHGKTVVKSGMAMAKERVEEKFSSGDGDDDHSPHKSNNSSQEDYSERRRSSDLPVKPAVKPKPKSSITTVLRSMSVRSKSSSSGSSKSTKVTSTSKVTTVKQSTSAVHRHSSFIPSHDRNTGSLYGASKSDTSWSSSAHSPARHSAWSSNAGRSQVTHSRWSSSDQSHVIQTPVSDWDKPVMARALWSYTAQMPCDLQFQKGDEIEVLTRTGTQDDWWEGKLNGKTGIFPANYTELVS